MTQRKLFGTDGIRGKVGLVPITADQVLKLGWAAGTVLRQKSETNRVVIGKDTRISGYMFESALEAGFAAAGMDVHLLGPMPTPGIAYLTKTLRAQTGVMISASHNPHTDNGIKFFSFEGFKLSDEIELAIEKILDKPLRTVSSEKLGRAHRVRDAAGRYIEFCKRACLSHLSLEGLKIVIDCANGATYHIAPHVFTELGANVIAIGNQPNGLNINEKCGSTNPNLLIQTVLSERANLGIAFDGDGDRLIMCDNQGRVLNGDHLLALLVRYYHRQTKNFIGIVGTVMTNMGLEKSLEAQGLSLIRTKVGDRYVLEALHQKGWLLGGETSGHIICLDANTTGDGIVAAVKILSALSYLNIDLEQVYDLFKPFPQLNQSITVEPGIQKYVMNDKRLKQIILQVKKQLGTKGRVLVRPSGTEPMIRIMLEAEELSLIESHASSIKLIIEQISQKAIICK